MEVYRGIGFHKEMSKKFPGWTYKVKSKIKNNIIIKTVLQDVGYHMKINSYSLNPDLREDFPNDENEYILQIIMIANDISINELKKKKKKNNIINNSGSKQNIALFEFYNMTMVREKLLLEKSWVSGEKSVKSSQLIGKKGLKKVFELIKYIKDIIAKEIYKIF